MTAPTTLRGALETVIRTHGYDHDHKTCQCIADSDDPAPISDAEHAAHVVNKILATFEGAR